MAGKMAVVGMKDRTMSTNSIRRCMSIFAGHQNVGELDTMAHTQAVATGMLDRRLT